MKVLISCKFEALIKLNNHEIYLNNNCEEVDIDQSTYGCVYPLSSNDNKISLPYSFKIKLTDNILTSSSNNLDIINFDNFAELNFLEYEIFRPSASYLLNSYSFFHNNNEIKTSIFANCENNFIITFPTETLTFTLKNALNATFNKCEQYLIVSYQNEINNLFIIDLNNRELKLDCQIEQFELDTQSKTLSFIKPLNDFLHHGIVSVYSLTNEFNILDEYPVYITNGQNIQNSNISEFIFFDCVKAKNFNKARTFLTIDLGESLSDSALFSYFEKFEKIKFCQQLQKYYVIPNGKNVIANEIIFSKNNELINNIKILYKN